MRKLVLLLFFCLPSWAETPLSVVSRPDAGQWEKAAAADLSRYLTKLTGQKVVQGEGGALTFVVGELALEQKPELRKRLAEVQKKEPVLRADAIVMKRDGAKVYLAGTNDDSHYFAVSAFLHRQGCRWYLPTELGECIPQRASLDLENLDVTYAPPFEVRTYWVSWNGDTTDYQTFAHRNFYNLDRQVSGTHALDGLLPKGDKVVLNSPETVELVASKLAVKQAQNKPLSLGISDAAQKLKSDTDRQLSGGLKDKFFNTAAASDTFLPLYNEVCRRLWEINPSSTSKVGFLAYTNLTLPPQRKITAAKQLIAFLAPIDIDPSHALTDPRSPERLDFAGALRRWARVMEGRVIMYDYDQGMMVWRDIPEPSHQVFAQDVKVYRELGILGFATESRNAIATTFTNLHFRGQLMWNPDLDLQAELDRFYPAFYGPVAQPMSRYWSAIDQSFAQTVAIDHEYFVIPALYPKALVAQLGTELSGAETEVEPYKTRLQVAKDGFAVLKGYRDMLTAGAENADYAAAVARGGEALAAREKLTERSGILTTYKKMGEKGAAWFPGEVEGYAQLLALSDGSQGRLLAKTPLVWSFRHDPHDHGLWQNWGESTDFSQWSRLSTGELPRGQGLYDESYHSPEGFGWYACEVDLPKLSGGERLMFPGIFNSSWLYINGNLVDFQERKGLWWHSDYTFRWDADVSSALKPGKNTIVLRTEMKQHPSGLFRRPFLYRPNR